MNDFLKILTFLIILQALFGFTSIAGPVQIIRVRVFDKNAFVPLEGAYITLSKTNPIIGTVISESFLKLVIIELLPLKRFDFQPHRTIRWLD